MRIIFKAYEGAYTVSWLEKKVRGGLTELGQLLSIVNT